MNYSPKVCLYCDVLILNFTFSRGKAENLVEYVLFWNWSPHLYPCKPRSVDFWGFRWTSCWEPVYLWTDNYFFNYFYFVPLHMYLGLATIFVEKNQNRSGTFPETKKGNENLHRIEQDATWMVGLTANKMARKLGHPITWLEN